MTKAIVHSGTRALAFRTLQGAALNMSDFSLRSTTLMLSQSSSLSTC